MKIAFPKLLKTEDLKIPHKIVKKMKTNLCAGSPLTSHVSNCGTNYEFTYPLDSLGNPVYQERNQQDEPVYSHSFTLSLVTHHK